MNEKMVLVTEEISCPKCGKPLTGHTSVSGERILPNVGDISICFWCASVLEYKEGLTMGVMSIEELNKFAKEDPLQFGALMEFRERIIEENRRKHIN